jgi:hypothetical protein
MIRSVRKLRAELGALVAEFDPRLVDAHTARELVEEFGAIERMATATRTLAAGRVATTRVWADEGDRSAAHWLARTTGSTVGDAVAALETARRLDACEATQAAFRAGALSVAQAGAITSAAAADPAAEGDLLAVAATAGVAGLRAEARRVEASARADEVAGDDAVRRTRHARQWVDPDGAWRMSVRGTVAAGARIWAAIDAAAGSGAESRDAAAFDALERLVTRADGVGASGPRATVHVRVDHAALVRGRTEAGEVCEIPGLGPIPVATARQLATDSILSVLVTNGVEVVGVAHAGRTVRANVRRALAERSPVCERPDCPVDHDLEIHHITGFAVTGDTRLDDLARLCRFDHYLATHHGYRLTGPPGARRWLPPDAADGRAPPHAA